MRVNRRLTKGIQEIRSRTFGGGVDQATEIMAFPVRFRPGNTWLKPAGVVAGGMAIVACGALLLAPAKAIGIEEIQAALKSVPASHTRSFSANGNVTYESWQEGTKRRYQLGDQIDRAYNGKVVWYTHPKDRYAVISSEKPDGFGFDGTGVENEIKSHQWETIGEPQVSRRQVVVNGQTYMEVTIQSRQRKTPKDVRKSVLLCRRSDSLPVRVDHSVIKDGKERKGGYSLNEYPSDIPDAHFDPQIPDGFVVCDEKAAYDQILSRLNNPAYQKSVNGVTITLLGVLVDRPWASWRSNSEAMVLFTGGATPHIDVTAGLFDETGKGYQPSLMYEADDRNRPRNYGKVDPTAKPLPPLNERKYHGKTADFPRHVRPLFYLRGQPVYCLRFSVESERWKHSWQATAIVPVSTATPPRVLKKDELGPFIEGSSKQVGTAKFADTVIPVDVFVLFLKQLDSKITAIDIMPLKGFDVKGPKDIQ